MIDRIRVPSIGLVDPAASWLRETGDALRQGRLIAYPTDTVYGLGVDPRIPEAVVRLFEAKGRPPGLAIPLIAADVAQVEAVGVLSPLARRLAGVFWPGPLTLVIRAHETVDRTLLAGGATVAVRVPDHPVARAVAATLAHPITATSANRSGLPSGRSGDEVAASLGDAVALVLDAGPSMDSLASTVVDASGERPVLIREGVVAWDRVLQSLM